MDIEILFLSVGALLLASLIIAFGAAKFGLPSLIAFLGLGMLLGVDGLGNIDFRNTDLAQIIGTAGLVVILFEGGLSTSWRRLRGVALPAVSLSTIGVVATALLAALAAYWLFDFPWLYAVLLGAVISSTDAAAVFASLRSSKIKRRIARTLEAESGLNDPMAIALTVGLISWIQYRGFGFDEMLVLILQELSIGLVFGLVIGYLAVKFFAKIPASIGSFAPVASLGLCALTFGLTQYLHGSGFLAVYLVGLAIGSTPSRYRSHLTTFHEGMAFLAQVIMFVALGLFVNPRDLVGVAGLAILMTLLLVFVIRPAAVWLSLPFSSFSKKEKLFIGVAGLRGAVPIVLATFVMAAGLEDSEKIFNIVFFVVLVSALFQGALLEKLASRFGLLDHIALLPQKKSDPNRKASLRFEVQEGHAIVGSRVNELGLPKGAHITSIVREGTEVEIDHDLHIISGDTVKITFHEAIRFEVEDSMIRWRRRI